ncbi:MAG: hypothetical protein WC985_03620 [Thermoplasmata archaeon]
MTVTFGFILLNTGTVPTVLVNAVVVVIAFYFGSGGPRSIHPPTPAGATPAVPAPKPPRLVKLLLFAGFLGLAGWFLRTNPSLGGLPLELVQVWEVLGGYVVGASLAWIVHRHAHEDPRNRRLATVFRDVSAAATLALTAYICFAYVGGLTSALAGRAEDILSLVVTYYFGSRVIAR